MEDDLEKEMKADQLRFWQSRPASECIQTAMDVSLEAYYRKHPDAGPPRGWHNARVQILPFPSPEDDSQK